MREWMGRGVVVLVAGLAGCSASNGSVAVSLGGEQAAEQGWPFEADGETFGFADGWSMQMDRVLVSVSSFALAGADGERVALDVDPVIADLSGGPVEAWRFDGIPAQRWDDVSWTIATPTTSSRRVGPVAEADVARMIANEWSFLLEGRLTHEAHGEFEVSVGLPLEIDNVDCEREDGTLGLVVPEGSVVQPELTFHLDHVFYDSLGAREPLLRFEAWAAAAGEDRVVTLDDLASQPLADLRGLDGMPLVDEEGAPLTYDPGPTPLATPDLRAFAIEAITTVGHFEGEGHCAYRTRE